MVLTGAPSRGTKVIVFLSLTGPAALPAPTACSCHSTSVPSSPPETRYDPSLEKETIHGACACQCTSEDRNDEPPLRRVGDECKEGKERAEPEAANGKIADDKEEEEDMGEEEDPITFIGNANGCDGDDDDDDDGFNDPPV